MKFSHIFIDRPILASVISVIIIIVGVVSYYSLPVAQYPEIAPPTIQVTAAYPGANAETAAQTVATPLEQEINGVEGMLYMLSQSGSDGSVSIQVVFELGTNLDEAQVLVQNRVSVAEPRLPEQVRRIGVTTEKASPDLLMVVNLYSPDSTYDQTYIANYAVLQLRDVLARIEGVGSIRLFGASAYAMRVWLDPERIAAFDLSPGKVLASLREQNVQVASGTLNQLPVQSQQAFELSIRTQGRFETPEEFEDIIVKASPEGRIVRVKDIGRVELGAENYITKGYLGKYPAIALPISQCPGSNALETARQVEETMKDRARDFPPGLEYTIVYNPTEFIAESINEVLRTIYEAVFLVVLVILVFLQSWRAAVIPILAIPVSLIGTFAAMAGLGYSLNNLSLFGLILAIGIVVDDAIVVVENMERHIEEGDSPREAAYKTMDEVGGAVLAIGLVLIAVFLPTIFLGGISGQFYSQFGVTISVATAISVLVSLTLSPAMAALLLRPKKAESPTEASRGFSWKRPLAPFTQGFNRFMNRLSAGYGKMVSRLLRRSFLVLGVYIILIGLTWFEFQRVPSGFIPAQDQGYFIVAVQLPPGSSLSRTEAVVQQIIDSLLATEGVVNVVGFAGFDGATFTAASNAAALFPRLASFEDRREKGIAYDALLGQLRQKLGSIDEAFVVVIPPPPVRGIGNAGGFKIMLEDRRSLGVETLEQSMNALIGAASQEPAITNVFSFFNTRTPQLFLDIDRVRAEKLGVPSSEIFGALELYLGSAFVNDFNYLGRTFRVTAQADAPHRLSEDDISRIRVRNQQGEEVSLGSVSTIRNLTGPSRVPRYNLYPAIDITGDIRPGYSTGEGLAAMERLAEDVLPEGIDYEWTELAYQQKATGNTAIIAFVMAVVFVFLLLAALYESLILPLAVILIVPMCLLSAMIGVDLAGMDNNILTQIGLVVLVGLASKNAILIIEFAKQLEDEGRSTWEAAIEAARLRLRPILMTSFAFILGVVPLMTASGAGAEMRQALGTTVFSGMLGVTFFGLVFYSGLLCALPKVRRGATSQRSISQNSLSI
ncbi:MAG: multidrug efflux RND transporter permease subunit [Bacteroidia bacterium]|nr:multidrug efflux RND transporter permease subunit [Bacteroidia bacterium]